MNKVDKDTLFRLYVAEQKPMHLIAEELGVAIGTVFNYLKKYGIDTRSHKETFTFKGHKLSEENKQRIMNLNKGKTLSKETKAKISIVKLKKGVGHKKYRCDGYVAIYMPDHPKSNKDGYIMEHHLVMECFIGRWIKSDEVVHHVNGIRSDNRIENLKLMTFKEHAGYHMSERHNKRRNDLSTR